MRSHADDAGAEIVGAILLFGIFVAMIAYLNVTAVPQAGLAAEEDHMRRALEALNALQSSAEAAALPANEGATVSGSIDLSPERSVGQDFFSFFLASPARASGELTYVQDYGNLTVTHYKQGSPIQLVDIGSPTQKFPLGRLTFDPHLNFRASQILQLENAAVVLADGGSSSIRFDPPISLVNESGAHRFTVKARVFNGTDASVGGNTITRVALLTEAATLVSPATPNARNVTFRLETAYGSAWGSFLNATSTAAGLHAWTIGAEVGYRTTVARDAAEGGLDVVTYRLFGATGENENDIMLAYGLGIYQLTLS